MGYEGDVANVKELMGVQHILSFWAPISDVWEVFTGRLIRYLGVST